MADETVVGSSNTHNTLEVGHIADLWHAGTERFYRARVIAAIASQEALAPFSDEDGPLKPSSIIERLERYKGCCTEASEAHQILTEAISLISALRRNDEVHWKTRRTLLRELASIKGEDGPGEEDGPWAEGWEVRRGAPETNVGAYDPTLGPPPRPKVPSAERWPKTPADLFDQYPVWTIFQKKSDGRVLALTPDDGVTHEARAPLKANACRCDPNPSIGGSPPCPVHDGESEDDNHV